MNTKGINTISQLNYNGFDSLQTLDGELTSKRTKLSAATNVKDQNRLLKDIARLEDLSVVIAGKISRTLQYLASYNVLFYNLIQVMERRLALEGPAAEGKLVATGRPKYLPLTLQMIAQVTTASKIM